MNLDCLDAEEAEPVLVDNSPRPEIFPQTQFSNHLLERPAVDL